MPDRLHHVIEGGGACELFMSHQLSAISYVYSVKQAVRSLQFSWSSMMSKYKIHHKVHNIIPSPLGDEWLCPAFNPPDIKFPLCALRDFVVQE
jgi:hypothetical protein